jgi:hypothetical protein
MSNSLLYKATFWLFLIGLTFVTRMPAHAAMLDWSSSAWTAGAPLPGSTATQDLSVDNPNDVTVAINNSGAGAQGVVWNAGSGGFPQINATAHTGGLSGVNGLQLLVSSSQVFGSYVTTTVSFAVPVFNVSFQLWGVDAVPGQFADQITNLRAVLSGGGPVGPNLVTSAVSGFNTITGSGLGTVVLGTATADNSTNEGTIIVTFNGGAITQLSFDWANNDPALGADGIGLGSLSYTPTPEVNPSWVATAIGILAVGVELIRRKKNLRRA